MAQTLMTVFTLNVYDLPGKELPGSIGSFDVIIHVTRFTRYMDVDEQTTNSTTLTFTDSCHPRDSEELCVTYVYSQSDLTNTIITEVCPLTYS